jgi:Tol biopolymer transport system component
MGWDCFRTPRFPGTSYRLSAESGSKTDPLWSRDGQSVYYISSSDTDFAVVRRYVAGGRGRDVLYRGKVEQLLSLQTLSPDGKHLLLLPFLNSEDQRVLELSVTARGDHRRVAGFCRAGCG